MLGPESGTQTNPAILKEPCHGNARKLYDVETETAFPIQSCRIVGDTRRQVPANVWD